MKLPSDVVGDSNDENNFPYKLLSTETQVSKLQKNDSSANIKFSKTYLHRIRQSEGSLGRLLGPLLKIGLPLIRNVLKPLAKRVLTSLGLIAAAATDAGIHKNVRISRDFFNNF